ncbi:unnamed protein product, partial [Polarella glacialis]
DDAFLDFPVAGLPSQGGGRYQGAKPWWRSCQTELIRGIVVRLYYSRFTTALHLGTLFLAALLLSVTLGLDTPLRDAPGSLLFIEGLITMSLVVEVALRAIVIGQGYLRSYSNVFDSFLAVLSASLFFYAAPNASRAKDDERQKEDVELSQSLVMARIILQFVRVMLIASHARRSRQSIFSAQSDVSFSDISELLKYSDLEQDLDFNVLREKELQERHRENDFGL